MEFLVGNALIIGADEFYRASRYEIPLVVMLINTDDRKAFDILEKSIRKTDVLQQLNSSTIIVFLSHTNYEESKLFLGKLRKKIHFTSTSAQYKGSEILFLRDLFVENEEKSQTI